MSDHTMDGVGGGGGVFNGIVRHKDEVFETWPFNDFSSSASWLCKTSSILKFHGDGDSWRIIEFSGAKGRWSDGQMIPITTIF